MHHQLLATSGMSAALENFPVLSYAAQQLTNPTDDSSPLHKRVTWVFLMSGVVTSESSCISLVIIFHYLLVPTSFCSIF